MILSVQHETHYRYDAPVRGVVQSHRLFPSECESQRVIDWRIEIDGAQLGGSWRDGAGDRIQAVSVAGPLETLVVRVRGRVETSDTAGVLRGHRERINPLVYMRETPATAVDVALDALARDAIAGETEDLGRAHALSHAVAGAIAYRPGVTHAHTTAAEALAGGEGVCQDHAHALIAVARVAGLPARYVSGYLFATQDGSPHEAAHAWAEVWVAGLGWVGFDPANACCADDRYIRLGSGLDARAAAPIRGIARGVAQESLDVQVAIDAAQQ